MTRLEKIKKYAETLSTAAKWENSGDAILSIENVDDINKKQEYIYEFYCALRILDDLSTTYSIEITNFKKNKVFPKAPASKKNYPFFVVKDSKGKQVFEICLGVDIKGIADETSAPDISFQNPGCGMNPDFNDVFMLFDSKFKHKLNAKVTDSEFYKVHGMIKNLACEDAFKTKTLSFNGLKDLLHNCILTNGKTFKINHKHHKIFGLKTIEHFDEDKTFSVYG